MVTIQNMTTVKKIEQSSLPAGSVECMSDIHQLGIATAYLKEIHMLVNDQTYKTTYRTVNASQSTSTNPIVYVIITTATPRGTHLRIGPGTDDSPDPDDVVIDLPEGAVYVTMDYVDSEKVYLSIFKWHNGAKQVLHSGYLGRNYSVKY